MEYKDVYGDFKTDSGRRQVTARGYPELSVKAVKRIWREAKLRSAGRIELRNLVKDMDVSASRVEELLGMIEENLKEIPCIDNRLAVKERIDYGQRVNCRSRRQETFR